MIATAPAEVLDAITQILLDRGLIPMMDSELAEQGHMNVIVGITSPADFGYHLTLVLEEA